MSSLHFRFIKLFLMILFFSFLAGCGGGGGNPGGISVSTSVINFSANRLGSPPSSQSFSISWSDSKIAGIVIGVPPGQSVPSWLDISLSGSDSPLRINVSVNTTNLPGGTYTVTLRVVSGDVNVNVIDIIDIPLTYTVTDSLASSTTALTYNYIQGSTVFPTSKTIALLGSGIRWNASANQPWVNLSTVSGMTPINTSVSVDTTNLPVGSHSAVITVVKVNAPSETVSINVTLKISSPSIQLNNTSLNFSGVNGSALASQSISFSLDNMQDSVWTASTSNPWIVLNATEWSAPDVVTVGIDANTTLLASGNHSGSIAFSTTYQGIAIGIIVPVNLTLVKPILSVQSGNLNFQGGPATDFFPQDISFSINTNTILHPWQITLVSDTGTGWFEINNTSGTVSQLTQSTTISINTVGQSGAKYTGSVVLSVSVNGDTLTHTIPVELILEPHRLFVPDNGVALLSTPSINKLAHTVTVSENRALATPWSAVSDQSWLIVTNAGVTDGDLVLTADASSLTPEMIHYADVTISSAASTITNSGQEIVRVGLFVTNLIPQVQVSTTLPESNKATGIVSDVVRPYVYITHGGSDIQVFNIYTGVLVSTISNAGIDLRNMTISSNGDMLYALDYGNKSIVSVNLTVSPFVANAAWTDPAWSSCTCSDAFSYSDLDYTRVNGRAVLVGGDRDIIDANNGNRLYPSDTISFLSQAVVSDITMNGSIMFSANTNSAGHFVWRKVLKYSEINDTFTITETHRVIKSGFNRGMSTDPLGERLYRACWYSGSEMEVYSGVNFSTISSVSTGTNGGALYGQDGLVYCARYYSDVSAGGASDVWSMNPATNIIVSDFNVAGEVVTRLFVISGDGQRLITRSNNLTTLTMTTIP